MRPAAAYFDGWRRLYGIYGSSVGDPVDDAIAREVWSWLLEGKHGVAAILALSSGNVAGFVHYRPFARTLHGNLACYLDDLFVDASHRGHGISAELVRQVCDVARSSGWTEVRWVTTPDNAPARRVYERIAQRSDLITYRIPLNDRR